MTDSQREYGLTLYSTGKYLDRQAANIEAMKRLAAMKEKRKNADKPAEPQPSMGWATCG